jgi:hypothetical protein
MTFPQANSDLKFFPRLFSLLLHKKEPIPGELLFKIIFSSKSTHPSALGLIISAVLGDTAIIYFGLIYGAIFDVSHILLEILLT